MLNICTNASQSHKTTTLNFKLTKITFMCPKPLWSLKNVIFVKPILLNHTDSVNKLKDDIPLMHR